MKPKQTIKHLIGLSAGWVLLCALLMSMHMARWTAVASLGYVVLTSCFYRITVIHKQRQRDQLLLEEARDVWLRQKERELTAALLEEFAGKEINSITRAELTQAIGKYMPETRIAPIKVDAEVRNNTIWIKINGE